MPMTFDLDLCDGCGKCSDVCPGDVIYMAGPVGKRKPFNRYVDECWHCGSCRQDCPQDAINVVFSPDMVCV